MMVILQHRHIHRREIMRNYDEIDPVNDDGDYESPIIVSSSINLPSTNAENPYDKVKAIDQKVIKKVPSKYAREKKSLLKEKIRTTSMG